MTGSWSSRSRSGTTSPLSHTEEELLGWAEDDLEMFKHLVGSYLARGRRAAFRALLAERHAQAETDEARSRLALALGVIDGLDPSTPQGR